MTAVATDVNAGLTANDEITITVIAGSPVILGSPRMAAGKFLFDVTGLLVGKTNIVQVSTNLATWVPVKTNVASSASITLTNAVGTKWQSYRVLQLP